LAGWVKEDAYAKASTHPNINPEKLTRWLENAEEFIAIVEEIFPDTFLMWRWLHFCLVFILSSNFPILLSLQGLTTGRLGLVVPPRIP
jgi:hypothetical protein